MNNIKLALYLLISFVISCNNMPTVVAKGELKIVKILDDHCIVSSSGDTSAAFGLTITNIGQFGCTNINAYIRIFENNKITENCFFEFPDLNPGDTAYSQTASMKYSSHEKYQTYNIAIDYQTETKLSE